MGGLRQVASAHGATCHTSMIDTLLAVLAIPTQFESSETGITEDIPQELSTWKDDALRALARLKSHVSPDCETDRKAEFIFYIAPFVGDEYWTSPAHSASALGQFIIMSEGTLAHRWKNSLNRWDLSRRKSFSNYSPTMSSPCLSRLLTPWSTLTREGSC